MLLEVNRYYPLLSDYIDMSDLPDFFCFVRDGLDEVFENAFCRDYYSSYSADGTTAYYSLTVMLKKRLSVGIAGTGMYLVVNPSEDGMTEFPFTLYRRWQILRVLRHFDTGSFSYSAEDFFNVALDLFGLNEVDLLRMAMDIFVVQRDGMSPFKTMEADINMLYGTDIDIDEYADGKRYNCDLSASYNIGARYFIKPSRSLLWPISGKRQCPHAGLFCSLLPAGECHSRGALSAPKLPEHLCPSVLLRPRA